MNEHRKNTVILSAWVDPALREYARLEARRQGVPFSTFIARAVQQAVSAASLERTLRDAETVAYIKSRESAQRLNDGDDGGGNGEDNQGGA